MTALLRSKLVFIDFPASDLDSSREFYTALLGAESFARSPTRQVESYFHPLSSDGIDLTIHPKREQEPPDIPVAYFAVDDLKEATAELEGLGGKIVHGPVEMPLPEGRALEHFRADAKRARVEVGTRIGQGVMMLDPGQNPIGIVQLEPAAAFYFRAGHFHQPLRADQVDGLRRALAEQPG